MRHRIGVRKLGKTPSHKRAMLRNMVTSLFQHERIKTTAPKAKEAKRWAERMITFGKRGDLHARRHAARFINDETVLKKDRKSTRLNSSHIQKSRMPSSA